MASGRSDLASETSCTTPGTESLHHGGQARMLLRDGHFRRTAQGKRLHGSSCWPLQACRRVHVHESFLYLLNPIRCDGLLAGLTLSPLRPTLQLFRVHPPQTSFGSAPARRSGP